MPRSAIAGQLGTSQTHVSRFLSARFAHLREELLAGRGRLKAADAGGPAGVALRAVMPTRTRRRRTPSHS
ncbi:hypothetical protein [Streptomyces sp. NPDC005017]|uniref:hypothetical protein n=1 Tax=Streptomyces sp. NPDC005017 TaxID=3364706 RepID=UPI0036C88F3E